jgi:type II secretory pathway pseudopilin PulG
VITAVIALVTIISDLVITTKEAAENAQKNLEAATEAANAAAEAVDNLASSYNEIVDNADKLDDLTKGTKEWREAV